MKENYLWDKSGDDAEIKKLEIALQAFRYQETAAPELPAKILPFKKEPSRVIFRFVAAIAACVIFGLTVTGIWLQFSNNKIENKSELAKVSAPVIEPTVSNASNNIKGNSAVSKPADLLVKSVAVSKQNTNQKAHKIRYAVTPLNPARTGMKIQNKDAAKPEVQLTKEEQYAYDQLMLALSITSSKLKIVKDKVEGIDETNAVLENGR